MHRLSETELQTILCKKVFFSLADMQEAVLQAEAGSRKSGRRFHCQVKEILNNPRLFMTVLNGLLEKDEAHVQLLALFPFSSSWAALDVWKEKERLFLCILDPAGCFPAYWDFLSATVGMNKNLFVWFCNMANNTSPHSLAMQALEGAVRLSHQENLSQYLAGVKILNPGKPACWQDFPEMGFFPDDSCLSDQIIYLAAGSLANGPLSAAGLPDTGIYAVLPQVSNVPATLYGRSTSPPPLQLTLAPTAAHPDDCCCIL